MKTPKLRTLAALSLTLLPALVANQLPAHADDSAPLVTVTESIDPKFSVDIRPDDVDRLAQELDGLNQLPPVRININELFTPGDEDAIRTAANAIGDKLRRSSLILADLSTIVYRMDALRQVLDGKDEQEVMKLYRTKFESRYQEFQAKIFLLSSEQIKAIEGCHSELCVKRVADAYRSLMEFMSNRSKKRSVNNRLARASLESTYQELTARTSKSSTRLVGAAMGNIVAASRAKQPFAGATRSFLGGKNVLRRLGLRTLSLPVNTVATEFGFLEDIQSGMMRSIVLGEEYKSPAKVGIYRSYVLHCNTDGKSDVAGWHALVFGQSKTSCKDDRTGRDYEVDFYTYGPGLQVKALGRASVIFINSVTPIRPSGIWAGPTVSVGAVLGGDASSMIGKQGSTALHLSVGGPWLGAVAGIGRMVISEL